QNRNDAPGWCQEQRQGSNGDWYVTIYDPESIMNYCSTEWNNAGKLSGLDIEAVQLIYGQPPTSSPPIKSRVEGSIGAPPATPTIAKPDLAPVETANQPADNPTQKRSQ